MKTTSYIKNDKGIALFFALVIVVLLSALGAVAMMMSQLGFTAISAEKKYQLANWAAEYGVYKGVERVINNAICPDTAATTGAIGSSSYSFFGVKDIDDGYCLIHATGRQGNARVNKTVVVPRAGADWGAMVAKGCNITLSGSSGIAGCDDDEVGYADRCGVITALIHDGAIVNSNAVSETLTLCRAEGKIKGLDGNPPEMRSPKTLQVDLVEKYFQVTDTNGNGTAWDELLEKIEVHYSNANRKIEFYDQTKTAAQKFGLPIGPPSNPPTPICSDYTFSGNPLCCKSTAANQITCYTSSNCSTGPLTPVIDLNDCRFDYTYDTSYPYISDSDRTVNYSYIKVNATGSPNKIVPATTWVINHADLRLAFVDNPVGQITINNNGIRIHTIDQSGTGVRINTAANNISIYGKGNVTIGAAANNIRIYREGNVTIDNALSATDGNPGSLIYASGNVTINANVGNHGADVCPSTFDSSTHIISGGRVNIGTQDIKNTNIFANEIYIRNRPDIEGSYAKVLYALTEINIDTNGGPCIGYPCGNQDRLHPLLFLVGDGNPNTGGSSFSVNGAGGNLTMDGMLFTDATTVAMTGAVEFQGTIINISTNCNINTTGNAVVQFNKRVLDGVYNQLCANIMQPVKCGGGNKKDYIANTEVTLY